MIPSLIKGYLLLIVGSIKLILGLSIIVIPVEIRQIYQNQKIIKDLIPAEKNTAELMLDISIIIIALFSIIEGLNILGYLNNRYLSYLILSHLFTSVVYIIVGILLIVYFNLVVYTDLDLGSKNKNDYSKYEIFGIGTGILLIMIVLIKYMYYNGLNMNAFVLLFLLFIWFVKTLLHALPKLDQGIHEFITHLLVILMGF